MIIPNIKRITTDSPPGIRDEVDRAVRQLTNLLTIPDLSTVAESSMAGYSAGWSDVAGQPVEWYESLSCVHMRGLAQKITPAFPDTLFTLSVGHRPFRKHTFWYGAHVIEVNTNGTVVLTAAPGYGGTTNLTGISFLVGA